MGIWVLRAWGLWGILHEEWYRSEKPAALGPPHPEESSPVCPGAFSIPRPGLTKRKPKGPDKGPFVTPPSLASGRFGKAPPC